MITNLQKILDILHHFKGRQYENNIYFIVFDSGLKVKEKRFTQVQYLSDSALWRFKCDLDYNVYQPEVFYLRTEQILQLNVFDIEQIALYE